VNDDFEIIDKDGLVRLVPKEEGTEVLLDTIELFNGIQDWERVEDPLEEEDLVSNIVLETAFDDQYPGWFNEITLVEPVTEIAPPLIGTTNRLKLANPVYTRDGFAILNEEGEQVTATINSGLGTDDIQLNFALEPGKLYTVTYFTALRDITSVIPGI